jgi:adenosylcobyric acid synthase
MKSLGSGKDKILARVKATEVRSGLKVSGYEIHHGLSRLAAKYRPFFKVTERGRRPCRDNEGMAATDGSIYGTYIHGIFDAGDFRRDFLNRIRSKKGWSALHKKAGFDPDIELDKLARLVRNNTDMKCLYNILGSGA